MRTILLVIALSIGFTGMAQLIPIAFQTDSMLINGVQSKVEHSALMGKYDDAESFYKKFVKQHVDAKLKESKDVFWAEQVMLSQVTDMRGDLMIYLYNADDQLRMAAGFKLGYDVFLNPVDHPAEYAKFKGFVKYAAQQYYADYLPDYIKAREKDLKSAEKEQKKLKSELKKIEKQQKSLQKKIKKAEKKIKGNKKDIQNMEESADSTQGPEIEELKLANLELGREVDQYKEEMNYSKGMIDVTQDKIKKLKPKIETARTRLKNAKAFYKEQEEMFEEK